MTKYRLITFNKTKKTIDVGAINSNKKELIDLALKIETNSEDLVSCEVAEIIYQ